MLRFKLKSLLSLVAVLAVVCAFVVLTLRQRRDQAELAVLRAEAGSISIDDADLIHVRNVETKDSYSWKWRVYVPPGTRLETGVELDGKWRTEGAPTGGASAVIPSVPVGVVLSVSVSPLVDGVSTIIVRINGQTRVTTTTNLSPSEWLPMPDNRIVAADSETKRFDYGTPIRLLARKTPSVSTDMWHPMGGKEVGLVVWSVPHKEP